MVKEPPELPQMDYGETILFLGAHCDDIEIGCGGTAAKLVAVGHKIIFAVATDCGSERQAEARAAAHIIGLNQDSIFFSTILDGKLDQNKEQLQRWFHELRQRFEPDTVFVHHADNNPDHQTVFSVAIRCFNQQTILQYYIPQMDTRRTEFSPNVTEDISEYMETKLRMCACHNSQAGKGIYLDPGTLTATAFLFFKEAHSTPKSKLSGHAEAFHIHILRRAVASHYYGEPDSTFDVVRGASAQAFRHHSYDWTNLVNGAVRVGRYVFEEFAADAVITFSGHSAIFASLVMVKVLPRERLLGMPVYLAMARDIDPAGTPPPLPGFAVVRGREGRFEVLVPHALADADPERKKNIAIIDDAITTGEAIITLKHYLLDTLEYRRASIRVGCFVCHELTTSLPDGRPDVWEFITDTTAYRLPWGDPLWFPRPGQ